MSTRLAPLIPCTLIAISVGMTAWLALAPIPGMPVAAVFSPWWPAARSFEAAASAGGSTVRFGILPNIVVAVAATPALPDRLRRAGAQSSLISHKIIAEDVAS